MISRLYLFNCSTRWNGGWGLGLGMAANYHGDWFVLLLFQVTFLDRLLTCHVFRSALLSSSTSSCCLLFVCKLSLNSQYTRVWGCLCICVCVYAHRIVSPDKTLRYINTYYYCCCHYLLQQELLCLVYILSLFPPPPYPLPSPYPRP